MLIASSTMLIIILFIVGLIMSFVFSFIPIILGRPWINYIVDFVLQAVFWFSLFYYTGKSTKK